MEERKRKISADLPPDLDDEVVGPMPAQAESKPVTKKRKGEEWREIQKKRQLMRTVDYTIQCFPLRRCTWRTYHVLRCMRRATCTGTSLHMSSVPSRFDAYVSCRVWCSDKGLHGQHLVVVTVLENVVIVALISLPDP